MIWDFESIPLAKFVLIASLLIPFVKKEHFHFLCIVKTILHLYLFFKQKKKSLLQQ